MQNNILETLKAAFEHSPIPYAVLDSKLHIIYTNAALTQKYGNLNNPMKLYMLFENVDHNAITNYLKSEKNYELICDLPDKKNAHIYLSAIFSDNGEFEGATATLPDSLESREDMLERLPNGDKSRASRQGFYDVFLGLCPFQYRGFG